MLRRVAAKQRNIPEGGILHSHAVKTSTFT
jgi:hypothetical protein